MIDEHMVSDEEIGRICALLVPRGCRHDGADMNALNPRGDAISVLTAVRARDVIERLVQDRARLLNQLRALQSA